MTIEYDLLIEKALIVDGTGAPGYEGELATKGERIAAISKENIEGDAAKVIDGSGHVVSPGFIDVHNHGDISILHYPRAEGFLHQGITTFVGGQCGNSPGPFGDWIGMPWFHSDIYRDINPVMYGNDWLMPRDAFNRRHREVYGWEIDWDTMGGFMERVEAEGISPNYAPMVGHGDVRSLVMGPDYKRHATEKEVEEMVRHTGQAMEEGCIGLTVGRDYDPGIWASFDEILACAEEAAKYGGVYASHSLRTGHRKPRRPGEFPPIKTLGVLEAIDVGRKTGMPVQVSHLGVLYDVVPSDDRKLSKAAIDATLKIIDDALEEGIDVHFDEIPNHLVGGVGTSPWLVHNLRPWLNIAGTPERLAEVLRMPDFREEVKDKIMSGRYYRFNPNIDRFWAKSKVIVECREERYLEKTVQEIAEAEGLDPLDALMDVLMADPYTKAVRRGDDDWAKLEFFKHPNAMIGVDTFAVDDKRESWYKPPSYPNENSYGGFARYLRRAVVETDTLTLEEAVRKITSNPASKFKLKDRGVLKEGAYADITVFNPETVTDRGDQVEPRRYAGGIPYVVVNGELVIEDSKHTGRLPGKVLRRE